MAEATRKPAPAPELARASESNDPVVHALLAQRGALEQWNTQCTETIAFMHKEIAVRTAELSDINKRLADLGYR